MKNGDMVMVISFNGKEKSEEEVDSSEDYWKIIGEKGVIQQDPQEKTIFAHFSKEPRVLVKFDINLHRVHGLHAHNNIENSLWILVSDLKVLV